MKRHAGLWIGSVLVLLLLAAAGLSYFWTPWPPFEMSLADRLQPPSWQHWLGTDAYGRDVASQLLLGARASIAVGVVAVAIGMLAGTALGLLAAARRGWVEDLLMRATDLGLAFPAILTAIVLAAVYGPGMGNAMLAIGIYNVPTFARLARGAANAVWARDFVRAARATGRGSWAITWWHVLPNLLPLLVVQATVRFGIAILAEAALSYLGLGTQPPQPSWGRLLSEAQTLMAQAPWLAVFPGCAIALAVLGVNLLGDGLRDWLDPRRDRSQGL